MRGGSDSEWIGWALAGSIPLFGAVFLIEYHRSNPLIDLRWIGTIDFLRFVLVGTVARIVLSEQTYGTVGLLAALGYTNDQLHLFSLLTTGAAIGGIIAGALIVGPNRLTQPVALAIGIVAIAAYIDSYSTNLTRPSELYITHVDRVPTTLYVGPAILIGFTKVLTDGGKTHQLHRLVCNDPVIGWAHRYCLAARSSPTGRSSIRSILSNT